MEKGLDGGSSGGWGFGFFIRSCGDWGRDFFKSTVACDAVGEREAGRSLREFLYIRQLFFRLDRPASKRFKPHGVSFGAQCCGFHRRTIGLKARIVSFA